MKELILKGCGTALVTPFTSTGEVDYQAYTRLVDRQVESGVHFLVPIATTAETPSLTSEEKLELMRITMEHAAGRRVMPGVGSNSVAATLANIKLLAQFDVTAYLVVVPFYNKPTQEGMYQYFKAVAQASDKPIFIYNVPGRTGANMTADTCIRLATEFTNIAGIKEASGNYSQVSEIVRRAPQGFSVLSGDDDMTLAFMATGAHGVVSVASNIAPALVSQMVEALQDNNMVRARELHHKLSPLFKACFVESNPVPAKSALSHLGFCTDQMRLPLTPATPATASLMADIITKLKL